ncbi:TRAP transporter small permease subunit [Thiomicrorhabdus indica]|uniref:TRAP transporter small permease subunit n=1 Tax=Thiomicrorhabdus indica TaxID=2267253 RepID=UPI002AA63F87|nr:TRAP transporter small permease subunit [Thiomicrorhabdus indica]
MNKLNPIFSLIVKLNQTTQTLVGHTIAWGTLTLVIVTAAVVILRYGFDFGSIAFQESIMYNHALVFMLGISYTYLKDEHVRVDLFYNQYSERKKYWVDLIGSLFLTLPVTIFIFWASSDYIAASWSISEGSPEAGGLGYIYLLKTLIFIMAGLLMLQALAIISQSILALNGITAIKHENHIQGGKL